MTFIRRVYNQLLRPYLPRKYAVYNGVPVKNVRLFDATDNFPNYEGPLLKAIRSRVGSGDKVIIVGGGLGVPSVVAVHRVSFSGLVAAYEGSAVRCELA